MTKTTLGIGFIGAGFMNRFHVASLVGVRIQVTHDAGSPTVGHVRGPVRRVLDGEHEFIEAQLEITDQTTRAAVARGDLLELSAGYSTEIDPTPGWHNGRPYRGRQRNIKFDHVALLPRDQRARCGEHCRVHFDSLSVSPQQKVPVMSCSCHPHRSDAVARRDAFRASEPHRRNMSDAEIDICLGVQARMDQQATAAAQQLPQHRADAATEARIDAAADVARVSRQDVHDYLRMNVAMHRGVMPTEEQIEHAVHAVRLRGFYTGGAR